MDDTFKIKIITPTADIIEESCYMAVVPSSEGSVGILKNHIPLISKISIGIIYLFKNEQEMFASFYIKGGLLEVAKDEVDIITNNIKNINSMNNNEIKMIISEKQKELLTDISDDHRQKNIEEIYYLTQISQSSN